MRRVIQLKRDAKRYFLFQNLMPYYSSGEVGFSLIVGGACGTPTGPFPG